MELEYDGTSFYWRTSRSGAHYSLIGTYAKASYLGADPTHIELGIWTGTTLSLRTSGFFDWIRRMA